jgi:hypothetical protein
LTGWLCSVFRKSIQNLWKYLLKKLLEDSSIKLGNNKNSKYCNITEKTRKKVSEEQEEQVQL